jgi:arylsulfatase A-like enzyme
VGRLVDSLQDLGIPEDTLTYAILGNNGVSAGGLLQGRFNEIAPLTGFPESESAEFLTERVYKFAAEAYIRHEVGWAHAMSTIDEATH